MPRCRLGRRAPGGGAAASGRRAERVTPATRVRQEDPEGAGAGLTRLTRPGRGRGLGGRGGTGPGAQKDMEAKPPLSLCPGTRGR